MEQMLVTVALNELKLLDKRINDKIHSAIFVVIAKESDKNAIKGISKIKFRADAKADYDSINDLIKRRQVLKNAIILSNAQTHVKIADMDMTVAEAIEYKNSIEYQKELLYTMESQYALAVSNMTTANNKVDATIDSMLEKLYGKDSDKKITAEDQDAVATPYRKANQHALVDELGIKERIESLKEFIGKFESEVDSVLQVSNCTTVIDF